MTTPQIIHPDGEWLLNSGTFSFYDPEAQVLFPPNVRVKAKYSNWAKGQPTIAPAADPWPTSPPPVPPAPAKPSKQA